MTPDMEESEAYVYRKMKCDSFGRKDLQVIAYAEDQDSPIVILRTTVGDVRLTDGEADELCSRIKRALRILPSSK